MNAYEYYLSTCKYVLLADPSNKSTWVDLYSYLPCLRQMMSCCVCGNIMLKPKGPGHGYCLHHVCSACIGGKMRLRPVCSWCRTHEGFVDNPSMRLLILCFKKMCVFINNSAIGKQIRRSVTNGSQTNTLIRVLDEGEAFEDDYVISNRVMPTCVPTYGMAPEPKFVSFPRRGSQGHIPGYNSIGGRSRRDSARSDSLQSESVSDDFPPALTSEQSETKPEKRHCSTDALTGDEFDKMPGLLAPSTRSFINSEKLSSSLSGPQNGDIVDQDQWLHVTRSGHYHGNRTQAPQKAQSTNIRPTTSAHKCTKRQLKNLEKGFASSQAESNTTSSKLRKHNIDFEPPCKRTRLASSLTVSDARSSGKACNCTFLNSSSYLNPSSHLTCFERCCPCYISQMPCANCVCGSSENPCKGSGTNGDKSDTESDPTMPILSPEPKL
ncbi:hypothetical protein ACOMHN_061069 [Nucella lapillus]